MERYILHVDVNNAFLSWTAVDMLSKGEKIDIRQIPSIIGGDEERRSILKYITIILIAYTSYFLHILIK